MRRGTFGLAVMFAVMVMLALIPSTGEQATPLRIEAAATPTSPPTPATSAATGAKAHCVKIEGTRLRVNAGDNNAYRMQFAEIEVYIRNPTGEQHSTFNIAPGSTVIASSSFEYVGWSTEKVIDGQWESMPGTLGWSSDSSLQVDHSEWIQLNLGDSYTINKVDLYPRNDSGAVGQGFPIDFTIQVTDDVLCASGWMTVVQRTDYPKPGDAGQSFHFEQVT